MFERNIIIKLEKWTEKSNRMPLILRGSRQVGKTTLVDSFSQNFEKNQSVITLASLTLHNSQKFSIPLM